MQETQEMRVRFLCWDDPLEEETATRSRILSWKFPWTEEPGGLQSTGSQRAGLDWTCKHAYQVAYTAPEHSNVYDFHQFIVVAQSLTNVQLRLPCPSLSPGACSNSCPLSQWCPPTISSSIAPFSSCPQSFPASGSFPMYWLFASGGQCIRAFASVLPIYVQSWCPLGLTGLICCCPGDSHESLSVKR